MKNKTSSITIDFEGVSLNVEYTFYPCYRGARDSLGGVRGAGPPIEPDEPAHIEISGITTKDDLFDLLSENRIIAIEEKIMEELSQEPDEEL